VIARDVRHVESHVVRRRFSSFLDRRETLYGHKVFLTGGASGLIVDCFVERGNPGDSTKAVKLAERAIKVLGKTAHYGCEARLASVRCRPGSDGSTSSPWCR